MDWFKRHLNWTVVIAAVVTNGLGGLIPYFVIVSLNTGWVLLFAAIAVYLGSFAWVLVQKGRSLWYISVAIGSIFVGYIFATMNIFFFFPLMSYASLPGFGVLVYLKNSKIPTGAGKT